MIGFFKRMGRPRPRWPVPLRARKPIPEPMFTMPGDNRWGHAIHWLDFERGGIHGHFDNIGPALAAVAARQATGENWSARRLMVGSIIRAEMQSGRFYLFRVTKLQWMSDPRDQFFGAVKPVGYEDEINDI